MYQAIFDCINYRQVRSDYFNLKSIIDYDPKLKSLYVTGEISNLKAQYNSGHLYFTLKDEKSEMRAVMFRGAASRVRFLPDNGMKVIIRGSISVYENKGQYQLICDDMQPDGIGDLTIAFEQLKEKLRSRGWFDEEKKRSIPYLPEKIGVVTASTGAAIHDILSILERRYPVAEIFFVPVAVQGVKAAAEISAAIDLLSETDCDVIIVGRGGGSIEDLWAFNEEIVAQSIYNCKIPVVSAVGHETDYTISDFTADLRAATPSAAAELCSTDWRDLVFTVDALQDRFSAAIKTIIAEKEAQTSALASALELASPQKAIISKTDAVNSSIVMMRKRIEAILRLKELELQNSLSTLEADNPAKILLKGFAIARDKSGKAVRSAKSLNTGDEFSLTFYDGDINCKVTENE